MPSFLRHQNQLPPSFLLRARSSQHQREQAVSCQNLRNDKYLPLGCAQHRTTTAAQPSESQNRSGSAVQNQWNRSRAPLSPTTSFSPRLYARSEHVNSTAINMTISSTLQSIFSFRTGSTTTLASLFYLAVFVSLYITQFGPRIPSVDRQHTLGLSVDQAFRDLHLVCLCAYMRFFIRLLSFFRRLQDDLTPTIRAKTTLYAISFYNGWTI